MAMIHIPNNDDQSMIQHADIIIRIAERISSPIRMEGRSVVTEMERLIICAQHIIESAEAIKIANPVK